MGNKNKPMILEDDFDLFRRIAKHGFVDFEYIYTDLHIKVKKREQSMSVSGNLSYIII